MRYKNNVLIIVPVVVAGFMLGVILSTSLPTKDNSPKTSTPSSNNQQTPTNTISSPKWQIALTANPQTIKSAGNTSAVNELSKIDKTTLTIKYDNTTSVSYENSFIRLTLKSQSRYGVGTLPDGIATSNAKAQSPDKPGAIFDIPSIKPNSKNEAKLFLFGRDKGEITVTSEIVSNGIAVAVSNPIKVKVE